MRKRFWFLAVLVLCVALLPISSLAMGKASVTRQTTATFDAYGDYEAYCFAEVENVGDQAIRLGEGVVTFYDAAGEPVDTEYVYFAPKVLQPGERTFINEYIDVDSADAVVRSEIELSFEPYTGAPAQRLPCTTAIEPTRRYGTDYPFGLVTIQNDTDQSVRNITIVYAFYDAEDNLLATRTINQSDLGIPAGSSVEWLCAAYYSQHDTWLEHGIEPARIDAEVYADL